jgi:hypothetical protein
MSKDFTEELRNVVMKMIVRHGEAFNPEVKTWGDSRGQSIYSADEHMKNCAPKSMTGYTEDFHWSIYDSMDTDSNIGIRAFITCECGQVENVAFIVPDAGLSTILGWLLEDN